MLPVLDITQRRLTLDRICIGAAADNQQFDTTITLRNRGNAPLTVTRAMAVGVTGRLDVMIDGFPVTIEPDSARSIPLALRPSSLGPLVTDLRFTSDGEPLVPGDTTIRVEGAGIVCGEIRIDTVRALVGTEATPVIRLDAGSLGAADVARLMIEAGVERTSLSVGYEPSIYRPQTGPQPGGLLAAADRTIDPAGGVLTIDLDPATMMLGGDGGPNDDIISTLPGDVLLGNADRTPLRLSVGTFADGFSRLEVRDGLLVAEYCAIDRRYVSLAKPFIRAVTTPTPVGGNLQLWLPESADVRVRLYNSLGSERGTLLDGSLGEGTHHVSLPEDLASGLYLVELRTGAEVRNLRILVE